MNHLFARSTSAAALAALLACGSFATAAEPARPAVDVAVRAATPADLPALNMISPQENDRRIARWLAIDNDMVLECAKLGASKAKNADVKRFAEALVAHHEKCAEELKAAVAKKGDASAKVEASNDAAEAKARENQNPKPALADSTPDKSRTAVLIQDDGRTRDARNLFTPTDFLTVQEHVARNLSGAAKKHFENLSEAEFDKAFVVHQVMAHQCMLANAKEVRSNASAEMQASIDRGIEKLQAHLEAAEKLAKSIGALPN